MTDWILLSTVPQSTAQPTNTTRRLVRQTWTAVWTTRVISVLSTTMCNKQSAAHRQTFAQKLKIFYASLWQIVSPSEVCLFCAVQMFLFSSLWTISIRIILLVCVLTVEKASARLTWVVIRSAQGLWYDLVAITAISYYCRVAFESVINLLHTRGGGGNGSIPV